MINVCVNMGGSRFSRGWGGAEGRHSQREEGMPTFYSAKISSKLHDKNEDNYTERVRGARPKFYYVDPLPINA